MKKIIYSALILLNSLQIFGQCGTGPVLTVNNPSFEGTPQPHVTPPGWDICMPGVTPDTQPGSWGCTLPPSNGSSYIGLVYAPSINWQEGAGQTLSSPMVAGTTYSFTIDLATMASADPATGIVLPPWCEYLELWGGMSGVNSGCDKAELLWSSPTVTNTTWSSYSLVFTPTSNWNHILFLINTPTPACTDGQYLLMDNMSAINPIADIAEFTWHDVCFGSPVQFHDSSTSVSGVINAWNWNFGDGTPNSTLQNPSHNYTTPGTYNVTLTTYSSVPCTTTMVHVINVWPSPTVTASAAPSIICVGQSSVLTGNGAATYSWQPGNLSGTTVTVTPAATTTYTVTGTSANGCTGSSTVLVTVVQSIVIAAVANPSTVCVGQPSLLTVSGASTYVWDPGAITGDSLTVNPLTTTTYTVTGTSGAGCSGVSTVTVTVVTSINISASANPAVICAGQSTSLSGIGAINYLWQPGALPGNSITVSPTSSTVYSVTGNNNGCSGSTTVTVDVYPNPNIVIAADIYKGCEDLLVQFSDLSNFTDATWYWDFGDYGFSYEQNPQHLYIDAGVYDVSLTITSSYGCTSMLVWPEMITVYKLPHAYFTPSPDIVSELEPTIFFNDQSIAADGWNWNFGDSNYINNISNFENPIHTYVDTGNYTVTLVAITNNGCTDTIQQNIYVDPNISYYVPNAFTPNDDGRNSTFTIQGEGIKWPTFAMRIYDRWGKTLYYTQDNEKGWDGSVKGKLAPEGVYTYLMTFTDIKFREYKLKGTVVLIK
jgi:gliding motility-associated-like protein